MSVCLSCSSNDSNLLYDFGELPAVNKFFSQDDVDSEKKYPLVLNYCKVCFLVQIEEVPPAEDLYQDYHHKSSASAGNVDHLKSFKDFIVDNFDLKTNILEIGSNDSTLLNLLNEEGFDIIGIDPAINLNQDDKNVISSFFNTEIVEKISNNYGKFDLIFGLNVFAHSKDFLDMFLAANELLKTDGTFIFEVAYADKTILKGNFDTIYHEHVCSYTLTSLNKVLSIAGFKIIDAYEIDTQGGSLRLVCKKLSTNLKTNNRFIKLLDREKKLGYSEVEFYESIAKSIQTKVDKINQFFEALYEKNKKILFIGAPARGVVVINLVKSLNKKNCIVIDDTKEKQNKLFPGTHIPVTQWEKVDFGNYDIAIILSWNYSDYLLDKLTSYGFKKDVYTLIPDIKKIS